MTLKVISQHFNFKNVNYLGRYFCTLKRGNNKYLKKDSWDDFILKVQCQTCDIFAIMILCIQKFCLFVLQSIWWFFHYKYKLLLFKQQIYSIDVYTDNYLPFVFKDLFRLLLNNFLLLGLVNISDTIALCAQPMQKLQDS